MPSRCPELAALALAVAACSAGPQFVGADDDFMGQPDRGECDPNKPHGAVHVHEHAGDTLFANAVRM